MDLNVNGHRHTIQSDPEAVNHFRVAWRAGGAHGSRLRLQSTAISQDVLRDSVRFWVMRTKRRIVVQQAHLRALTHADQFEGRAALNPWLTRIVTKKALILLRRGVRSIDIDDVSLASPKQDSEQEAAGSQMEAVLLGAIETLPELYRTVFCVLATGEKMAT